MLAGQMLPNGRYPLSVAADYGQKEVIEFLITKGADINVSKSCRLYKHDAVEPVLGNLCLGRPLSWATKILVTECFELYVLAKKATKCQTQPMLVGRSGEHYFHLNELPEHTSSWQFN